MFKQNTVETTETSWMRCHITKWATSLFSSFSPEKSMVSQICSCPIRKCEHSSMRSFGARTKKLRSSTLQYDWRAAYTWLKTCRVIPLHTLLRPAGSEKQFTVRSQNEDSESSDNARACPARQCRAGRPRPVSPFSRTCAKPQRA